MKDNAEVGDFALSALEELGYDSVLARGGEQALAEVDRSCARFHIQFTDVVQGSAASNWPAAFDPITRICRLF